MEHWVAMATNLNTPDFLLLSQLGAEILSVNTREALEFWVCVNHSGSVKAAWRRNSLCFLYILVSHIPSLSTF